MTFTEENGKKGFRRCGEFLPFPESSEMFKVGRSDRKLGVVFTLAVPGGTFDWEGRWHKTARFLVEWDGKTWENLSERSARTLIKAVGISKPTKEMTMKVSKAVGNQAFWKDLRDRFLLGQDIDSVKEVMGS